MKHSGQPLGPGSEPGLQQAAATRSQSKPGDGRLGGLPEPVLLVLSVALFVALEWLSFLHQHDGLPVTPWNPGLGLMLALAVIRGPAYTVALFVGVVLSELLVLRSSLPLYIDIAVGVILAGIYGVLAYVLRGLLDFERREGNVFKTSDILVLWSGGLAGAVLAATLLSGLLLSISRFDLGDITRTLTPLVLGDLIGIVVVTPLVLRAFQVDKQTAPFTLTTAVEAVGFGLFVLGLLLVILEQDQQQSLFYVLFLPVVVAAVRHGIDGACAALTIVQLVLVSVLHFYGFDLNRFTEFQFLMLMLTLTGLVVGALVSERRAADEKASAAAARLRELEAEAARAARLNLISGMAAALAHEINQPMTAARALARSVQHLVREQVSSLPTSSASVSPPSRVEQNVVAMIEQIDHAGNVVRRMREFLRRGEPNASSLDISQVLDEAISLSKLLTDEKNISIETLRALDLPIVFADRVQVQQVVVNLVRNAVESIYEHAIPDGRILVAAVASAEPGFVEIMVRDNGPGIDDARTGSIFEPLSTSRPDGIGLGLSICKTIIQAHGGRIWLASSRSGATEFRFTLPAGSPGREAESKD